jgi:DNA polymerase III alpha subunit
VDRELLEAHHEGLICLSGVSREKSPTTSRWDGKKWQWTRQDITRGFSARIITLRYRNMTGLGPKIFEISQALDIPLVATHDSIT